MSITDTLVHSTPRLRRAPVLEPEPATGLVPSPRLALLKRVLRGERAPLDLAETREVLGELARRKVGQLSAELLVGQVLAVTEGADWPSRRAALDALLRRVGFALRDELRVVDRPARGAVLGRYALAGGKGRQQPALRPYRTEVYGLQPLRVSCDCADFLRSSLGVCKHALVVLEDIAASPRRVKAAASEQASWQRSTAFLSWEPVRSWSGNGDRAAGLRWQRVPLDGSDGRDKPRRTRRPAVLETLRAGFDAAGSPLPGVLADLEQRRALLEALLASVEAQLAEAEPAALALVREEIELACRRRAGRAGAKELLQHTKTLKRKLYPYQREGIQRFFQEQRLLLADDMGLGKTTQAIAVCHALHEAGRVRRGLLIVPAPLKSQWRREWEATTDRVPLIVVEGRQEERAALYLETQQGFLVMNYEQLLRDLDLVRRFAPEIVVLDEAQRIKNWASKSSAYVMSLAPEWRLVLTGTPMENRLEELATLLDWVDDTALQPKWRLLPWHTSWGSQGANERVGARHLDTLRTRMSHCVLRRVRQDVLRQLPPRTDVRVPVEMTSQQREEHDALIVPIARLVQSARKRPLRQGEFLKLMQLLAQQRIISNGLAQLQFDAVWPTYSRSVADEALLGASCSPKLVEFRRLIRSLVLEQGRKVVVFSQWLRMLRLSEWAVRDLLEAVGLRSAFFTGEESQDQRSRNIVDFHDDASVRVMFLSDAGGVGLNLQRAANACINLELPWNPAVLEQRIGRIYRLGQESPIDVINLVTEYGIEARIAGLVGNKKAVFSGLFDGTTDSVAFDAPSGFLKDIERIVDPVEVPALAADADASEADASDADATEPNSPEPNGNEANRAAPVLAEPAPAPALASSPEAREARDVADLFARIRVTRSEDGGLRLDVPPDAAGELSQLLEGLAGLVRAAASAPR
jgi:hypothetical protein